MKSWCVHTLVLSLALCSVSFLSFADDNTGNSQSQNQGNINTVKGTIAVDKHKVTALQNKLKQHDIEIGQLESSLRNLTETLNNENKILRTLKQEEKNLLASLEQQRKQLLEQIRTRYVLGQHSAVKLVFNEEDPALINRTLLYFSYINENRLNTMAEMKSNLDNLVQNQAKTAQHIENIKTLKTQRQDMLAHMQEQQMQQQALLAQINAGLKDAKVKLSTLESNKDNFESIVYQLDKKAQVETITPPPLSFTQLKGKLPWPVRGALAEAFGSKIPDTPLQSSGVVLQAEEGDSVRAIYPGKVVFADWLRGFGLLIIIDHGNGYMSLYGRNETLKVNREDHVNAGTVIAEVGKSGGFSTSGLYFEIRRNGEPINPANWCETALL